MWISLFISGTHGECESRESVLSARLDDDDDDDDVDDHFSIVGDIRVVSDNMIDVFVF